MGRLLVNSVKVTIFISINLGTPNSDIQKRHQKNHTVQLSAVLPNASGTNYRNHSQVVGCINLSTESNPPTLLFISTMAPRRSIRSSTPSNDYRKGQYIEVSLVGEIMIMRTIFVVLVSNEPI